MNPKPTSTFRVRSKTLTVQESWMEILALQPTEQEKIKFAKAMAYSLRLDLSAGKIPNPPTPTEIKDKLGYNLKAQFTLGISVLKPSAYQFLTEINCPTINSTFRNTYTKESYREVFEREVTLFNKKKMLLTYAEWLHFVDHPVKISLPPIFERFLA